MTIGSTVTKREIYTIENDEYNTGSIEVSIIQYEEDTGATIQFGDLLKMDSRDLIALSDLVSYLTK